MGSLILTVRVCVALYGLMTAVRYGSGMGSLSLEASNDNSTWDQLWAKKGDQVRVHLHRRWSVPPVLSAASTWL
jgi:hypothetical protein